MEYFAGLVEKEMLDICPDLYENPKDHVYGLLSYIVYAAKEELDEITSIKNTIEDTEKWIDGSEKFKARYLKYLNDKLNNKLSRISDDSKKYLQLSHKL